MCSHQNRLIDAILMSSHNIPFLNMKKKIVLNYPKSAAMFFSFPNDQNEFETASKLAISVRVTEGLLYTLFCKIKLI